MYSLSYRTVKVIHRLFPGAILRYSKLSDAEVLLRLQEIIKAEQVTCTDDGLEALLFTASGDMRQAINNLQSTHSGFEIVNAEHVFKVCDQPHPLIVQEILDLCRGGALQVCSQEAIQESIDSCLTIPSEPTRN